MLKELGGHRLRVDVVADQDGVLLANLHNLSLEVCDRCWDGYGVHLGCHRNCVIRTSRVVSQFQGSNGFADYIGMEKKNSQSRRSTLPIRIAFSLMITRPVASLGLQPPAPSSYCLTDPG